MSTPENNGILSLLEDETEGREEETLAESLERREESSLSNEPRGDQPRPLIRNIRIPELTDEEKRDECASIVSFTSSLYSDPDGVRSAALLLSRINTNTTQNSTITQTNNQMVTEDVNTLDILPQTREQAEVREDSPTEEELRNSVTSLITAEDIPLQILDAAASPANETEDADKRNEEDDSSPPIDSTELLFQKDLISKPHSFLAIHYPKRFSEYWRDETNEKICTLHVPSKICPDAIIKAASESSLFANVCITPEVVVPVDIDYKKNLKRSVKIIINNGDQTIVLARSSQVGIVVLDEANEKIKELLEEKVSHFFKTLKKKEQQQNNTDNSQKHNENTKSYEFIYEEIPDNNVRFPYASTAATQEPVLLAKTMNFINELTCRSDNNSLGSISQDDSVQLNKLVEENIITRPSGNTKDNNDQDDNDDDNDNESPEVDVLQLNDKWSNSFKEESSPSFGSKLMNNMRSLVFCGPLNACAVDHTIGRMCVGPLQSR